MIINSFSSSYQDGVTIEPLVFKHNMSLLVGPSGVGKTTILNSLNDLKKIIRGASVNGFKWSIDISFNNVGYKWSGEFSYVKKDILDSISIDPKDDFIKMLLSDIGKKLKVQEYDDGVILLNEELYINKKIVLKRTQNETKFSRKNIGVKLPDNESTLISLRDEPEIKEFISAIKRISILDDSYLSVEGINVRHLSPKNKSDGEGEENDLSLNDLKEKEWRIEKKLNFCQENLPLVFDEIQEKYRDIFPFIDKIIVKKFVYQESATRYLILIKEQGSETLVPGDALSSGMSKVLMLLCYFYLSNENIVFLIDEFENGLGVNCLDEIVTLLSSCEYNENIQFIMTSHHPYIINNIDMRNWMVIARNKNVIKSYDPIIDLNLSTSRHEAFLSLINSPVYEEGVSL